MSLSRAARALLGGLFVLTFLLLAGCVAPLQSRQLSSDAFAPTELASVPFFPQEEYQCGPAALAMVLQWAGKNVAPDVLAPQVYLPSRRGSLQLELVANARRYGAVPYIIQPRFEDLLAEVAAGHPVIVLQNLAYTWYPKWHYAVVVGFDLVRGQMVLRSGLEERHTVPVTTFERTWRRGDYWAMVVMSPGRIPRTAEETRYLQAVVALERLQHWNATTEAYRTALVRWPQSLTAQLGLGNSRYALKDYPGAEAAYRNAVTAHPESGIAWNNLAQALADQHRWKEAETAIREAIARGGSHISIYEATYAQIRQQRQTDDTGATR